jgi:hypothetical protein
MRAKCARVTLLLLPMTRFALVSFLAGALACNNTSQAASHDAGGPSCAYTEGSDGGTWNCGDAGAYTVCQNDPAIDGGVAPSSCPVCLHCMPASEYPGSLWICTCAPEECLPLDESYYGRCPSECTAAACH